MTNINKLSQSPKFALAAPVGAQMPDLDYSDTQAIILKRWNCFAKGGNDLQGHDFEF